MAQLAYLMMMGKLSASLEALAEAQPLSLSKSWTPLVRSHSV